MSGILKHRFETGPSAEGRKRVLIRLAIISAVAVALIASIVVVSSSSPSIDADPEVIHSGTCGKNVEYKHYSDGTLVISATGDGGRMDDYSDVKNQPWRGFAGEVTSVTIGDGITHIGSGAFQELRNLKSVTMSDSVKTMGGCAFRYCSSLESVVFSGSLTEIPIFAFEGCGALESVTLPNFLRVIGENSFAKTGLTTVIIPNYVTDIMKGAFANSELKSVVIGKSVRNISGMAFHECKELTSVTLYSVNSVGMFVFQGTKMTTIALPIELSSKGLTDMFKRSRITTLSLPGVNYAGTPSQAIPDSTFHQNGAPIESPTWKDIKGKTWHGPGDNNFYTGSLTVTLDPNDGSQATTKTVTYGQTYGDLPAPASGGKTFAGWFTEQSGGSEVKADTKVMYVDSQTLYAHWDRNSSEIIPNRGREPPFPFLLRSNFHNRIAMGPLGSL